MLMSHRLFFRKSDPVVMAEESHRPLVQRPEHGSRFYRIEAPFSPGSSDSCEGKVDAAAIR